MAVPAGAYKKEEQNMPAQHTTSASSRPEPKSHTILGNEDLDISQQLPGWSMPLTRLEVLSLNLPKVWINSFCGAMAGVASGVVTCPLDVIKTKLQAQGGFRSANGRRPPSSRAIYRGMLGTARVIWTEDGLRGMYRGLGPMLLGYLPTWAVYMSVYEKSKEFYFRRTGILQI